MLRRCRGRGKGRWLGRQIARARFALGVCVCVCWFVSEPLSSDGNLRDRSDPQAATSDRQLNITHTPAWPHNCMYYVAMWWRFGGTVATSATGRGTCSCWNGDCSAVSTFNRPQQQLATLSQKHAADDLLHENSLSSGWTGSGRGRGRSDKVPG